ncbi:lmo0937 family membrane protein [Paenibacillus daejeonensis]|nr:lmo0937 family membrane protein [Paenibacillus daejeonensis]
MLWAIFVIILIFWGIGFAIDLAGGLIHILLVFALIALIFNLVRGRRGV